MDHRPRLTSLYRHLLKLEKLLKYTFKHLGPFCLLHFFLKPFQVIMEQTRLSDYLVPPPLMNVAVILERKNAWWNIKAIGKRTMRFWRVRS